MSAFKLFLGLSSFALVRSQQVTFEVCKGSLKGIGYNTELNKCMLMPSDPDSGNNQQTYVKITGSVASPVAELYQDSPTCSEDKKLIEQHFTCGECTSMKVEGTEIGFMSDCSPPPPPQTGSGNVKIAMCGPGAGSEEQEVPLGMCVPAGSDVVPYMMIQGTTEHPVIVVYTDGSCTNANGLFVRLSCDCMSAGEGMGIKLAGCSSGLSGGAIAGIVIGVLAGVALISVVGFMLYKKSSSNYGNM